MRFANKELFKTLRFRIGLAFVAVCTPLMALMVYNSVYAGNVVREQVAQSTQNLVSLYMGQIDRSLEEADEYLYQMAAQETDFVILDQPDSYYSLRYQEAKIRLSNKISADINYYKTADMFFVYSDNNDDFFVGPKNDQTFEQRDQARILLTGLLKHRDKADTRCIQSWCVQRVQNGYFLLHAVKVGNVYAGAWVNAKRLMIPLNLIDFGDTGLAVLVTSEQEPMDHNDFVRDKGIKFAQDEAPFSITGNKEAYLEVGEPSAKGEFRLVTLIPEKAIMEKLPIFQRIVLLVPIGFVFILLLLLFLVRKHILRPIYRMLTAMRRIKEGHWDAQIPHYPASGEFEVMNATFNEMVSQIQTLKISVYEEQLNHQRAELKHLQLQINPHFFLNSLNIIYHLAQARKYELIKEMSLSLVEYFRYMFRSNLSFVPLSDEIRHTCNYLTIQKMRFPGHLTYEVAAEPATDLVPVPPLIMQTFVENTIKHAVTMDEPIHIRVTVTANAAKEPERLFIRIEDTGKGFPPAVLSQLQSDQDLINEKGENIGIWNVRRRLELLYSSRAVIVFSNGKDGGATVDITLPIMNKEQQSFDKTKPLLE
ncbi:Sensor histidine kinase YehU [Paenibacillus konkukensis]|uniref:histidine kinase n=1 Tax=Paenibacillus konkukensis TaxID=2020716 RepID=A0ABY4RMW5_9BACL|nr:histidine kinase [Paenibacillus konkukensis]UQZ83345.1 Sensor histidine kinase YehU [Paenibacillus konkukensis]